jgi:hypothetical protein
MLPTIPRRLLQLAGILVLAISSGAAMQGPQSQRVIAVGDVHGDLDRFIAILQKAGLIDASRQWTGGSATLVQTGDLLDRGPKSRALMEFLMTLEREAPRRGGGSVRLTLGNHEVMNIMGNVDYVVAEDYAAFADSRSEQRRRAAFRDYTRVQARKGRPAHEADWFQAHPPGFVELREAYGPQGKYGRWLRGLNVVNKVDDSIFLHGGINPNLGFKSVEQINAVAKREIQTFDRITAYMIEKGLALPFFTIDEFARAANDEVERIRSLRVADPMQEMRRHRQVLEEFLQAGNWITIHDDGPLWYRGYSYWTDEEGERLSLQLIQTLGVKRIIVGHTPQSNSEIRQRFGGKIFLIDTGMYRGRPSALEISDSRIRALYPNREVNFE